jgi:fatty acid desaturase
MKKNMGTADRIIRIILAAVFATLYFTNIVTGAAGVILLIVGAVFLVTSLISFCPLYTLIGLNTCAVKKQQV